MRAILLWVLFLLSPAVLNAQVFQWTDGRGVIHWTDNPASIPETIRRSRALIIRTDLEETRVSSGFSNQPENANEAPLLQPGLPETVSPPEPEQKTVAPPTIPYNPQQLNIVVVNSIVNHSRKHPCPGSEGCQGVFRPNFDDRKYIHPSVFNGGTRQFIQPELSPSNRR